MAGLQRGDELTYDLVDAALDRGDVESAGSLNSCRYVGRRLAIVGDLPSEEPIGPIDGPPMRWALGSNAAPAGRPARTSRPGLANAQPMRARHTSAITSSASRCPVPGMSVARVPPSIVPNCADRGTRSALRVSCGPWSETGLWPHFAGAGSMIAGEFWPHRPVLSLGV